MDALDASGFDGDLDTVFSRSAMVSGVAMLIGTVGGGLLGQLDLSLPFVARSGLLTLAFVVALLAMRDLGFAARPLTLETLRRELSTVAKAGIRHGWSQRSLRLLMLASAVQTGFIIWGFYAWQPYFLELLQTDAIWFAGVIASGVALSTMARQRSGGLLRPPVRQAHHVARVGGEHPDRGGDRYRPVAELPAGPDLPARGDREHGRGRPGAAGLHPQDGAR